MVVVPRGACGQGSIGGGPFPDSEEGGFLSHGLALPGARSDQAGPVRANHIAVSNRVSPEKNASTSTSSDLPVNSLLSGCRCRLVMHQWDFDPARGALEQRTGIVNRPLERGEPRLQSFGMPVQFVAEERTVSPSYVVLAKMISRVVRPGPERTVVVNHREVG